MFIRSQMSRRADWSSTLLPRLALLIALLFATPMVRAQALAGADAHIAAARDAMMTDPHGALNQADAARHLLARESGDAAERGRATADWLRAEALSRLDQNARAAPIAAGALAITANRWPRTKLHADLLMTNGGIAKEQNRLGEALADFQQAHNLFRDLGETRSQTITLLMLASLYQDGSDHRTALRYFGQAIETLHGSDRNLLLSIRNNIGNTYDSLRRYDDAAREYGEALKIARTMDSPRLLVAVTTNVARAQIAQGKLAAAGRTLAEAARVPHAGDAGDRSLRVVAARLALARGDPGRAAALIDEVFARTDLEATLSATAEAHEVAYAAYRGVGRLREALTHLLALKQIDDKAARLATDAGNLLMSARFDSANKELQIQKLRADEAQRRAELARTRSLLLGGALFVVVAGAGLLGFGLLQLRRSRNQVRAANVELAASNTALGAALKAKSDFLATTSHEFRTPLNGILGMTQVLLADAEMPAGALGRLEMLQDAGIAMQTLVEDVLDVAMLDSGKVRLAIAPFDLRAALGALADHWQSEAEAKQLGFARDLAACPAIVEGDARRIGQVVGHLLSNAVKFTLTGGVSLAVSACEDGAVEISVTDTGIGIPEDEQERVFDKFHQVDTGRSRQFGGVGVGLTVARNLARAMGGSIALESRLGEGAAFRFRLPIGMPEAPRTPANGVRLADSRVLLVEPNRLAQSVLLHSLEPFVAAAEAVGDLAAAHARLAAGGIHHLIVQSEAAADAPVPLRALAALAEAAGAGTNVVVLHPPGAFAEAELRAIGSIRWLAKPVALSTLVAALTSEALPHADARAA